MAIIKTVRGHSPVFDSSCYLADTAVLVGEVVLGKNCTVWFHAVVRGDVHSITIGDGTNIQDGAVIHGTYQKAKTVIGNQVSIAHGAIVHGCTVEDNVLIGMRSVIMDDAVIGSGSVIAAGAVVLPGTIVEPGSVYAGVPARRVKDVSAEMKGVILRTARNYPMYATWFRESGEEMQGNG
jgi:carbonic anhydrase/acetyltransferase-like protein (isoleucine patch superfamily)